MSFKVAAFRAVALKGCCLQNCCALGVLCVRIVACPGALLLAILGSLESLGSLRRPLGGFSGRHLGGPLACLEGLLGHLGVGSASGEAS